jgi:hypothetical protein
MNLKTILGAALAVVAIGSSALAWREHLELEHLRVTSLGADERAELRKEAWDATKRANQLADQLKRHSGADDSAAAPDRQKSALGDMTSLIFSRMDDPEVRRLMDIQQKASLGRRYAAFFRTLNLPPDQLDHLKDLLLEKQSVQLDVLMAASQQGINPMQNPDEFKKMVSDNQAEVDAKIQADLGDGQYAQFQNYQNTQAQRGVVNQLRSDLSFTDAPLSGPQADQLVQIMAQTAPAKTSANGLGGGADAPGGGGPSSVITDATIALSQSVLAPGQVDALRQIQQQQQASAQLQKLMFQNQNGGASGGPATPPPTASPEKNR